MANNGTKTIKRSRKGCHNCKRLKIKCDEKKPQCSYCVKTKADCDYSIKLTWGGRPYKNSKKRTSAPVPAAGGVPSGKKAKSVPMQFIMSQNGSMNSNTSDGFKMSPSMSNVSTTSKEDSVTPFSVSGGSPGYDAASDTQTPVNIDMWGINTHGTPDPPQNGSDHVREHAIAPLHQTANTQHQKTFGSSPKSLSNESQFDHLSHHYTKEPLDGLETLTHALGKVEGHPFVHNSEIFNRFIAGVDDKSLNNTIPQVSPITGPVPEIEDDFLVDYTNDLVKVEAYLPKQSSNFLAEQLSRFSSAKSSPRQIEPLDEDDNEQYQKLSLEFATDGATSPSMFNYYTDNIPPSLTAYPELLNQVPHYRQLMHFWVNVAAVNLVPAPSHIYKENPFQVLLPQMAMEYPAILSTILACAATMMASLTGRPPPTEIVDQLVARSCTMLLKMLQDKKEATSNGTLATVLLLSCYELLCGNSYEKHRAHYMGARQIVMARHLQLPGMEEGPLSASPVATSMGLVSSPEKPLVSDSDSSRGSIPSGVEMESDVNFFLIRWFVYIDVLGALSSSRSAVDYLNRPEEDHVITRSLDIVNSQSSAESDTIDPKRDIDYILGFDVKFLTHFTNIVLLIRKTEDYLSNEAARSDTPVIPLDIVTAALEVKDSIESAFSEGEERRQAIIDKMYGSIGVSSKDLTRKSKKYNTLIKQDNILRCTNKLFFDMGLLNLYRRVLKVPRESSIIRNITQEMGQIVENHITPLSPADICSIFCSFCAACDTLDEYYRSLFQDRFTKLAASGNVHAAKSLQIMRRCWDTGEDWITACRFLGIELTLL